MTKTKSDFNLAKNARLINSQYRNTYLKSMYKRVRRNVATLQNTYNADPMFAMQDGVDNRSSTHHTGGDVTGIAMAQSGNNWVKGTSVQDLTRLLSAVSKGPNMQQASAHQKVSNASIVTPEDYFSSVETRVSAMDH